mmetsp:Transcript_56824/g.146255  ORF Transcript_56824/g.146255 Transcript_56824/m.146255 type:complete len:747 (+) Transcript_56824:44-2284(+)
MAGPEEEEDADRRQELREQRAALQGAVSLEAVSERDDDAAVTPPPETWSASAQDDKRAPRLASAGSVAASESAATEAAGLDASAATAATVADAASAGPASPTATNLGASRRLRGSLRKVEPPIPVSQRPQEPKVCDAKGRRRNAKVVAREKETKKIHTSAGERSMWPETRVTKHHQDQWNQGHKYTYENAGMHPNKRSYFDRWLDPRGPNDPPIAGLKPEWRLDAAGAPSQEEKDALRALMSSQSATCSPIVPDSSPPEPKPPGARRELRQSRRTPWTEQAPGLLWEEGYEEDQEEDEEGEEDAGGDEEGGDPRQEAEWLPWPEPKLHPGGGGFGDRLDAVERLEGATPDYVPKDVAFFNASTRAEAGSLGWDDHHHVTWCNERNVGMVHKLNPSSLRNYFDRTREPEIGARSAEARQTAEIEALEGSQVGKRVAPVVPRILPVWRLEPVRGGGGRLPDAEELKQRKLPLRARTGHGGSISQSASAAALASSQSLASSAGAAGSRSTPALGGSSDYTGTTSKSSESRLPTSPAQRRREVGWQHRHSVVFRNEDVSRLDRSYFDRYREAEALLSPKMDERQQRGGVHVWALEHAGNPAEEAAKVTAAADKRFSTDGKWNYRHGNMFSNHIQANARSYFDRFREFPEMASDPRVVQRSRIEDGDSTDPPVMPPSRWPTFAAECRTREKLSDKDQLPVKWKLHEPGPRNPKERASLESTFRQPVSNGSKDDKRKEKRRTAWFSSHNVVF